MSTQKKHNSEIVATFMFTDIVGYSTLINKNQSLALKLLEEHNQILKPSIENHNGEIIKHTGDGYFACFLSKEDAVVSAVEFQTKIKHRNEITQNKHQFQVRVGIHKGEAVKKNNDLFGHNINVASRIEGLCVFGGIAISDDLFASLDTANIFTRKMGYVKMKNIREPLLLHNVYLSKEDWQSQTDNELVQNQLKRGIQIVDINEYQIQNTYSVGICFFKCQEGEDQKRISDNLVENIMVDFEKINDVRTASKMDVAKYTNSSYTIYDIAHKLQVNNILEGELVFNDDNMNLNIKLFSTFKGDYVFDETYECGIDNTNFLRTKVLTRIMKEFDLEIPAYILESLSRKMSENSLAIEKYNKGKYYIERLSSMDDIEKAHQLFKEACELDSHFIEALTQYGLTFQKLGEFEEAEEYLEKALAQAEEEKYDDGIAFIYNYMGILYKAWGKMKLSLKYLEKALELQNKLDDNLQEAKILNNISGHYIRDGNTEKALVCLERARDIMIDLDQIPLLAYIFNSFGNLYNRQENYSKSLENKEKTVTICEEHSMMQLQSQVTVDLADCHANLGLFDSTLSYIDKALPLLEEFDNVMAIGRSYLIQGRIMSNMDDSEAAIDSIKDSIEEFQMCDQHWLILIGNLELAMIYTCDASHKNAERTFNKIFKLGRKIKGLDIYVLLAKMLQASFDKDKNPDDLYEEIKPYQSEPATYQHWYFLSESYANLDMHDKAKECIKTSQKLLKERALKNSNKEHQESMLNNIPLHQKIINA